MANEVKVTLVECANNGGCGECACPCHTDVPDPGPHIETCKFADPDYTPPDFLESCLASLGGGASA
jgi:hypothetical protein